MNALEDDRSKIALTLAIERRDTLAIQILLDAGADANASTAILQGSSALEVAVQNNDIDMVQYLLDIGADADERSLIAAVPSSVELVQILLAARLSHYQRFSMGYGCSALQHAIRAKNAAMVEILIAYGIDANAIVRPNIGNTAAYFSRNVSSVNCGESALGTAIQTDRSNDLWIVQMLLRGGANAKSIVIESPKSPALLATNNQVNLPLVNLLIAAGADATASLYGGISRTPLQLAAEKGSIDIVLLLLDHSADVNAPPYDRCGATALQFAAIGGYVGIALLLRKRGADINAPPAGLEGRTALEGAAEHGRIDVLQLLLSAGSQITGSGSVQYERAKKFASENGHIAARRLLEAHRAKLSEDFVDWDLRQ